MRRLRSAILVSLILGALSLVAVALSHLALTDIYHGEADLALEWRVVQVSALLIVAFQVVALATLGRLAWRIPDR